MTISGGVEKWYPANRRFFVTVFLLAKFFFTKCNSAQL